MKRIVVLLLIAVNCMYAQDLTYGKVTVEDFKVESEDKTDEHDAVYILNKVTVNFVDYKQYISIHQRIRIETEEGLDYATKQVNLYTSKNGNETLVGLKGATYSLTDNKVVRSELGEDILFKEDLNDNYVSQSFTMPEVRIGSIIEYSYVIKSPFPYIDDINLQYSIPTINLDVAIQFPSYYTYNVVFNPRSSYKINFDPEDFKEGVSFSMINPEDSDDFEESQKIQQLRISNQTIGFMEKNIPALLPEPFSGDLDKYRAKMIINIAAFNNLRTGTIKKYGTSWEAVAKSIYDSEKFGNEIERSTRFFRRDLEEAMLVVSDPKKKVDAALNFLKSKVKWNGDYGLFTKEGLKDAYKIGSGNVSEVNLLLVSMLRELGIEADPVLVSSTNNDIPIFPTREGFNYVIVQANYGGEKVLLDATEKFAGINLIPLRAANWKGRLIKEDGSSEWINLTNYTKSTETVLLTLKLDENSQAIGKASKRLTSYMALDYRIKNINSTSDDLEKYIQNDKVGLQIDEVSVTGLASVEDYVTLNYKVAYKNAFDKVGDKIYITPLLFESNEENAFKLDSRKLPLDLSYLIHAKTIVNIEIPEGYEVESLPESIKAVYNNDIGYYQYVTGYTNGLISTVATFNMEVSVVQPEDYKAFKKFFEAIVSKDAEKIVLRKI
ncbi:DUF3857 domain-containing protein [Nonlabens sp. Ci31]|uniref:DUF3857 domain-containing protein n=1 Tax=Nonlabens sp. Ci31 TaxID=2608253 RepID=UPI001464825B|nr:DUF3857 domain-containing protein [Nonlabens sp. Ci31]QJP33420.1 DUF3857 domain-containing protein [Nonlabens sp. Ci31]